MEVDSHILARVVVLQVLSRCCPASVPSQPLGLGEESHQESVGPDARSLEVLERFRPQSAAAEEVARFLASAPEDLPPQALSTMEVPRFALGDPDWLQFLSDNGYVVLKGALDESELKRGHDLLWDYVQPAIGWKRGRMETWEQGHCGLADNVGIIKFPGAGQSEVVWHVRTRPSVKEAFARIWGTDELISAFDGFNVFLPWHYGFRKTADGWLHADQGYAKRGLHAVQGFVALTDQDATTGGLRVIPGSHHRHSEWVTVDNGHSDFVKIGKWGSGKKLLALPQQLVTCRAGDLVLWDSRCVHCNTRATVRPTTPEGELLRVAIYVCMTKKSSASSAELQLRQRAYKMGVSSNHWPVFSELEFEHFRSSAGIAPSPPSLESTTDGRQHLIA